MSQYERNITILNRKRIIYSRQPINDIPTFENNEYMYFEDGTHECYELFRSTAKISTYKSLKWHLIVLKYLNDDLEDDEFMDLSREVADKKNGFVSFHMNDDLLIKMVADINKGIDIAPNNKLRKVIFKIYCGLTKKEKLSIVGELIGRSRKISPDDVYSGMVYLHDINQKITIQGLSVLLNVSSRTIHRYMCKELKQEKEILNRSI
jgi:hypothetical protein